MADTDPNTDVAKLQASLQAEREAHAATKSKHREFCASLSKARGLPEDSAPEALLSSLGDEETRVAERTKALQDERDAAQAKAADVEARWSAEKVEAALSAAFIKSGMKPENAEDALALARPLFTVDPKTGAVVTKADAPNTVPGQSAEAWAMSELRARRTHWFPGNVSAGARGGGHAPASLAGADSCFDPRSKAHNFTAQLAYEARFGTEAASRARAKYRHTGKGFV